MSFDLYLVSFADHKPSGVPRTLVREAFAEQVRWEDEDSGWTQLTSNDGCRIGLGPLKSDPSLISCVCINRPLSDERFLNALYQILRLGNVALFFPGGKGPLIAEPSVGNHLPPDMFESLGTPIVVANGREIAEQIRSS
jgi:hypothetical protein